MFSSSDNVPILNGTIFHESSKLDMHIYFSLYQYKFFSYIFFYYSIFQLIVVPGFTIISPFIALFTIVFCVFIYYNFSTDNIVFDVKYEKIRRRLKVYFFVILGLLVASLTDIILTFACSLDDVKLLFELNDFQRVKFGVVALTVIFSRIILFPILLYVNWLLYKKIEIFQNQKSK